MSMIIFKFMMEMLIMVTIIIDQVLGLYCAGHVTLTIVMSKMNMKIMMVILIMITMNIDQWPQSSSHDLEQTSEVSLPSGKPPPCQENQVNVIQSDSDDSRLLNLTESNSK